MKGIRMKKVMLAIVVLSSVILSGCCSKCPKSTCAKKINAVALGTHAAVTPVSKPDKWWQDRHTAVLERVKQGNVDMIFIGDSITHGWEGEGKVTWNKYYAPRNAINLGYGGDQTQHVLWRLQNGEISGISPKLAVIMIGTNNSGGNAYTAQQIADGIIAIVQKLRADLPNTKILLLAIFPRSEKPDAQRQKNTEASCIASKVADNKMVFYKDINRVFLDNDGTLPKDIMPDFLHPNAKGYELEAAALELTVEKLMGENCPSKPVCPIKCAK
jgi:lysophospholipase L1-like esterase